MSAHNLPEELSQSVFPDTFTIGTPAIIAGGATVPTDATAGYLKGCLFLYSGGTTLDTTWYMNIGSATSCDFDVATTS